MSEYHILGGEGMSELEPLYLPTFKGGVEGEPWFPSPCVVFLYN
jgi:hypothetical protein